MNAQKVALQDTLYLVTPLNLPSVQELEVIHLEYDIDLEACSLAKPTQVSGLMIDKVRSAIRTGFQFTITEE